MISFANNTVEYLWNLEQMATKGYLVSLEAKFYAEEHIKSPRKSVLGKKKWWTFLYKVLYFKIYVMLTSMINRFEEAIALKCSVRVC